MPSDTDPDLEPVVVPPSLRQRRAYICEHKDHGDQLVRVFLLPGESDEPKPRCPMHGVMKLQPNVPYKKRTDRLHPNQRQ